MQRRARLLSLGIAAASSAVLAGAACSVQNARIGITAPPYGPQSWRPVADYLDNRCGTLDCHGQIGRNLRIYGCTGLRLSPTDTPATCAVATTEAEYEATYRSLVALEPQVMTTVYTECATAVGSDGLAVYPPPPQSNCHPELLTFIRKARGIETHKGGQLICTQAPCPDGIPPPAPLSDGGSGLPVDPQDVCLVSWLEGATDSVACAAAFGIPNFPLPDAGTE
jgi:hypothetical protein